MRTLGWVLLSLVVLLSGASGPMTAAASAPPPTPTLVPTLHQLLGEGPWVVRATYGGPASQREAAVRQTAAWIEPWEVDAAAGYLLTDVDPTGYQRLLDAGFRVEIDPRMTARLNRSNVPLDGQVTGIPGYPCYRTVEETYATAQDLVAAHPTLAVWIDVGDSWEKATPGGEPGYDLMVLRLTNSAVGDEKPKLFVTSSIHAREYTPAELMTRFAEALLDGYGTDPDATWLLDYHEIHLMLHANPDGRKKAETGLSWRKNTNEAYCGATSNYRGADLNRNFAFYWGCCGGSSGDECNLTYRGPDPASEPETRAIQTYLQAQFPDQRDSDLGAAAPVTATGIYLDIHSYSQLVLWPWGFTSTVPPNGTALQTLGRKMAYFNSYQPIQSYDLYVTDGATDDYGYGELGIASYVFELGTAFFQDCTSFENTILPHNLPALRYAAKAARTPYLTPAGPDALAVMVSQAGVTPGEGVTLSATLDDTRYDNQNGTEPTQNIAAARYTVDVPPWDPAAIVHAMDAADGAFDATTEAVRAAVDTSGLSLGRHLLFVQGQDADGNWGAVSAAFLYALDPLQAPTLAGHVHDAATNAPLAATVRAGAFQTTGTPDQGRYHLRVLSGTYTLEASAPGYATLVVTDIVAHDGQALRHDLDLDPVCAIFSDDVEGGNAGWTAEAPWAISIEDAHSPTHAWNDSPGGNYSNNRDISLTSPALDLSDYDDPVLGFWHRYDLEEGWDYGYVEISVDGGSTWTQVAAYSERNHTDWEPVELALPQLAGESDARVRFRLKSDIYVTADGWMIDDVTLSGIGPGCITPQPPTITLDAPAAIPLGAPMAPDNQTRGSTPLSFAWDFGDGTGSALEYPTHAYDSLGAHTVWLTATNAHGTAVASTTVEAYNVVTWTGATGAGWDDPANWITHQGTLSAPTRFDAVVVPATARWPLLSQAATVRTLDLRPGAQMTLDAAATLSVREAVTNAGRLHQQRPVNGSGPVAFLELQDEGGAAHYHGLVISPTAAMGTVTVTVRGRQACGGTGTLSQTVQRCYEVHPELDASATITFYYRAEEANGNAAPSVYHHVGGPTWELRPTSPVSQTTGAWRWATASVDAYSPFALKDPPNPPTALRARRMAAWDGLGLALAGVTMLLAATWHAWRRTERG
jgi:PKD repeat protein